MIYLISKTGKIIAERSRDQHDLNEEMKRFHSSQKKRVIIQPSSMKYSKGTPIMNILYDDSYLLDFYLVDDVTVNDRNWEDYSIQVRADFVDILAQYELVDMFDRDYGNTESLYKFCSFDEYEKIKKTPLFLQNVISQRDASNYLSVHKNKQITCDVSNHILSFF